MFDTAGTETQWKFVKTSTIPPFVLVYAEFGSDMTGLINQSKELRPGIWSRVRKRTRGGVIMTFWWKMQYKPESFQLHR